MKAIWNNTLIAESNETVLLENNHYFPRETVNKEFLIASGTHTICPWKGEASYYTLSVDGKMNPDAAWFYPDPKPAARQIKNYIAFWKGVRVSQ